MGVKGSAEEGPPPMPIQIHLPARSWPCVPLDMVALFILVSLGAGLLAGQKLQTSCSVCHRMKLYPGSPLHCVPKSESAQAGQVFVTGEIVQISPAPGETSMPGVCGELDLLTMPRHTPAWPETSLPWKPTGAEARKTESSWGMSCGKPLSEDKFSKERRGWGLGEGLGMEE